MFTQKKKKKGRELVNNHFWFDSFIALLGLEIEREISQCVYRANFGYLGDETIENKKIENNSFVLSKYLSIYK